jgi:hypothetical protein
MNPQTNSLGPALLSNSELRWLLGDINVSKSFEYKIKSSIRRKIQILTELELPLLIENNFFATDDYDKVDDNLGRDLESRPHNLKHNVALVRQRSRVQIPAKASLFCEKEEESGSFRFYLPYTVFHFLYSVFNSSHNECHNCCSSNRPCLTMTFLLL